MMLREVTAIETGGVVLKVNGVKLRFDDVVFIPEKYLDCEIKTIGSDRNRLMLEIHNKAKDSEPVEAIARIG